MRGTKECHWGDGPVGAGELVGLLEWDPMGTYCCGPPVSLLEWDYGLVGTGELADWRDGGLIFNIFCNNGRNVYFR